MLQNKKYIKFAYENTVEVIALGRLQEGIENKDRKAETYKGEDGKEYLVEFPGMTVQQMLDLNGSKAGSYNNTGKIPYTAIVNPFDEQEMSNLPGGISGKQLMAAVEEARKQLNAEHGPSVNRKDVEKLDKDAEKIRDLKEKGKLTQAIADALKLQAKQEKEHDFLKAKAKALVDEMFAAATAQLDEAEGLIGRGEAKDAQKILGPLSRALKGTELEERANALLDQSKGAG